MGFEREIFKDVSGSDLNKIKERFHEFATKSSEEYLIDFNSEYESMAYSLGLAYGEGYSIVNTLVKEEVLPFMNSGLKVKINQEDFYDKMKKFTTWDEVFDECIRENSINIKGNEQEVEKLENSIEDKIVLELRTKIYSVVMNVYSTMEELIHDTQKRKLLK